MDVDQYGFDRAEPRGRAPVDYAEAVSRQAAAAKLADLAAAVFALCADKAQYHRDGDKAARRALESTSSFLGMDDKRRRDASWAIGYHHGRAEAWNASAIWWHKLTEAHKTAATSP